MKTLNKSIAWLFAGLLMFSGCNNIEEPGSSQPNENELPPYSVTFRLGGSASIVSDAVASRAEVQTEAEKTVHSLYAVVFKNAAGGSTTGAVDPVDNTEDKFYTAFPVDLSGYSSDPQTNPNLSFSLAEEGNFQVCFVANPSGHNDTAESRTELAEAISELTVGSSTVAEFKALVEDAVLDAAAAPSQYLMTSPFYTLTTSFTTPQTIAEVQLTRAMARFDIINAADGYTITEVVFHNRATKTPLISDAPGYVAENVIATTTYTQELVGSSTEPTEHKAAIYSFEQYAGNGSDFETGITGLPYLEIKYKVPSLSADRIYSHNVYFKKAKGEQQPAEGYTVLPIKRNTLYKIKMVNDPNANLSFNITVLDWDKNTEIEVPQEDLIEGVSSKPLEEAAIGDFYMADGTLRDGTKELTETDKAKVIGIVFQTDVDRIGNAEKTALSDKNIKTPHGLVMAVKLANSGTQCKWKEDNTEEDGLEYMDNIQKSYADISGLSNYNQVNTNDAGYTDHPAFKAVADFEVAAPESSTDWFLPSVGQWWDIMENLGGFSEKMSAYRNNSTPNIWFHYKRDNPDEDDINLGVGDQQYVIQKNINTYLKKLGSHADLFSESAGTTYWTSSEYSGTCARNVYFNSTNFYVNYYGKTTNVYVRAVLAF